MPQNNKSTAKSPFTPKPVVYAAWGLLAAALVAHFVPALEAVALILYAVGLIALCLLALTAPKKGTIAVPRVFLPMLAAAFHCSINDLPLTIILSWYEQKAVAVLLTLLSLGVKNIKLGPSLPAFVSPATLRLLVEKFNIGPVTTPDEDIAAALK